MLWLHALLDSRLACSWLRLCSAGGFGRTGMWTVETIETLARRTGVQVDPASDQTTKYAVVNVYGCVPVGHFGHVVCARVYIRVAAVGLDVGRDAWGTGADGPSV